MKTSSLLAAVAAAVLACVPANAVTGVDQALSDMRALNLIVLGDYNGGGHDVEGKAWVGGNLTNGTTIGFGHSANPSQSAVTSSYSTLTVLGSASGNINLDTGSGVGGNYGATIVGDVGQLNINGTNATVKIGGNANNYMSISSGSSVTVHGNSAGADVSSGASLIVGGSLGNFNASQNSTVSMGSYSGGNKVAVSQGSSVYVGSSINQAENNGGTLQVTGSIGDMQGYGQNSVTKVTGSIGGNGNGIGNAPAYIYAGGSVAGTQNANGNASNIHQNYNYAAQGAVSAPTTLGTPAVPTVTSLSTMSANMQALSTALLSATTSNATASWFATPGDSQQLTIQATSTGADALAIINITQAALASFSEINYSFSDPNVTVIINVLTGNASALANHDASYSFNLNAVGGTGSSTNQQVIWNFADAGTLNVNDSEWGSILAPYATVSNNGNVNGTLVAKVFNQSGEVHLGTYDGSTTFLDPAVQPGPVPEPASWAMMLSGFGVVGTMIRRRRRSDDLAKAA